MNKEKDKNKIAELIETGSELTGSITGSVIGALFAGVPGAITGGAAGPLIAKIFKKVGLEIKERVLGNREEVRIGAAYTFALNKINEKLIAGEKPRDDNYFETSSNNRSASEEILEGALLLAQREYEELKVKHFGYLIANIYFDSKIDRAFANFLLRTSEKLSYRQFCLLELFNDTNKFELYKRYEYNPNDFNPSEIIFTPRTFNYPMYSQVSLKHKKADLDIELKELHQLGLLDLELILIENYNNVKLTSTGKLLRKLMELSEINNDDIEVIAKVMRYTEEKPYL